jgi:hypothetical protein
MLLLTHFYAPGSRSRTKRILFFRDPWYNGHKGGDRLVKYRSPLGQLDKKAGSRPAGIDPTGADLRRGHFSAPGSPASPGPSAAQCGLSVIVLEKAAKWSAGRQHRRDRLVFMDSRVRTILRPCTGVDRPLRQPLLTKSWFGCTSIAVGRQWTGSSGS